MEKSRLILKRLLALAALVLAVVLIFVIVGNNTGSGDGGKGGAKTGKKDGSKTKKKVYVIKEGDTLTAISASTGIPVEKIQELNPDLDPQTLISGQSLKLR